MNKSEIEKIVKEKILFDGLNLVAMDIELENLTNEKELFGPLGLGIDSVDALEIILGLKRHFSIDIGDAGADLFSIRLRTIGNLIDYVDEQLNKSI